MKTNRISRLYEKKRVDLDPPKFQPYLKYSIQSDTVHVIHKHIQISPNVFLSIRKTGDRFFLTRDKQNVEMKYSFKMGDGYFVCGEPFVSKGNFFENPVESMRYAIYETNEQKGASSFFNISRIKCKLVRLSYKNKFVFMPILHSFDEFNECSPSQR